MRKVRKSQSQKERQWLLMMANVGTKELMAKLETMVNFMVVIKETNI